jgi:glycine/D-amino acid oxidase-like deaminating enzyme
MVSTSLWQSEMKDQNLKLVIDPLKGDVNTQVAIIGAGITGAATALWLARAGLQVRVLEARDIAAGASGRNGGFISAGTTASYAHVIERYGHEQARRLWAFTVRNQEMLTGFIDELEQSRWSCSYDSESQTYDETPNEVVQKHLDSFVHETLNLPQVKITNRWAGIMGFTADSLPLIGRLPGLQNCFIAGGYTGHGNAFAIHGSKLVSELVQEKMHPDAGLFDPARFDRGQ